MSLSHSSSSYKPFSKVHIGDNALLSSIQNEVVSLKELELASHPFFQCTLDLLGTTHGHRMQVGVYFDLERIILFPVESSFSASSAKHSKITMAYLEHAHQCPMRAASKYWKQHLDSTNDQNHNNTWSDFISSLSTEQLQLLGGEDASKPSVLVGVCVVIQNQNQEVLLTRRASHMRTFPMAWVVPGGHLELGESLQTAACREVQEETGVNIEPHQLELLCVYESVYPVELAVGFPQRHHIVFYFLTTINTNSTLYIPNFDPKEVEAAAWLNAESVKVALDVTQQCSEDKTIEALVYEGSHWAHQKIMLRQIQSVRDPNTGQLPKERITTGVRYALREWVAKLHSKI